MAFEVPLDADRVDDLNLFSTFIRAPVIGTLLWILGGDKGYQAENQSTVQRLDDDHNSISDHNNIGATIGNGILATDCDSQYNSNRLTHYELISMKRHYSKEQRGNTATLKKASPSLIGSDISECEVRESLDAMCLYNNNSNINEKSCVNFVPGLKKKELSWSDEFGNNLVKYEEESTTHEPNPPDEQPVRSALSRSRSVRSDANWISEQSSQIENKYLSSNVYSRPTNNSNTLLKHHHPTMPYNNNGVEPFSSGTGGYDSPQWGWYINTTPPSPDMYFTAGGRPTKSMKISGLSIPSDVSSGGDSTASSQLIQSSMVTGSSNAHPNPVFQCLQDKHKAAPMVAWPSVPL